VQGRKAHVSCTSVEIWKKRYILVNHRIYPDTHVQEVFRMSFTLSGSKPCRGNMLFLLGADFFFGLQNHEGENFYPLPTMVG